MGRGGTFLLGVVRVSVATLAAAAAVLAADGCPVFPCAPGRKTPLIPRAHPPGHPCRGECGRDGHGLYDATCDPEKIAWWWRRWPRANIGVATGTPGPDVLDVDVRADGAGWAAFERCRRAGLLTGAVALVRTPSGGLHAWFPGTEQPSRAFRRHFLDLKARGGYVLAPPSQVAGRGYAWLDRRAQGRPVDAARLAWLLDPPAQPDPPRRSRGLAGMGALARWVARQPEGNRNRALYWAACRAVEAGADGELDALVAAACHAGLPEREARATVASARRRMQGGAA